MARLAPHALLLLSAALWGCDTPARDAAPGPAASTAERADALMPELRDIGYDLGSPDAPVVVVEFSDFGCPYCARFALETFPILNQEYVQTGQVRWKYVPFALGTFPNGEDAALAGECGGAQDRFWAMHDQLYLAQNEWKATTRPAETFAGIAERAGLDAEQFARCFGQREREPVVQGSTAAARQLGVTGTPTFFVNGQPVQGAPPVEQFRQLMDLAVSGAL